MVGTWHRLIDDPVGIGTDVFLRIFQLAPDARRAFPSFSGMSDTQLLSDVVFRSSDVMYCSDDLVFRSDDVMYCSDDVVFRSSDVMYCSDDVVFRSDDAMYCSDAVVIRSDDAMYCSDDVVFRSDDVMYCSDAVVFRSHATRFVRAVDFVMSNLDALDVIVVQNLVRLGRHHAAAVAEFRVEYLKVFEQAMTDVWAQRLGARQFDARARLAWSKIFCLITSQVSDGYNEYKTTKPPSVASPGHQ